MENPKDNRLLADVTIEEFVEELIELKLVEWTSWRETGDSTRTDRRWLRWLIDLSWKNDNLEEKYIYEHYILGSQTSDKALVGGHIRYSYLQLGSDIGSALLSEDKYVRAYAVSVSC